MAFLKKDKEKEETQTHTAEIASSTPVPEDSTPVVPEKTKGGKKKPQKVKRTRAGASWISLVLGALVLIFLLVFIIQNLDPQKFNFLAWNFTLPVGIAMIFAAIAGAIIMALVGAVRMYQLRRQVKQVQKQK